MHPEVEAMDVDEVPENIINLNTIKIRSRNANRIRNLNASRATRDRKDPKCLMRTNKKSSTVWLFLKLLLFAVCIGAFIVHLSNTKELGEHLKNNYYKAYERMSRLYNDLCTKRRANFTPIVEAIAGNVIGQQHLHEELDDWFQTIGNSSYSCALFVGATGVGKSFTANIIAKHYPYPRNVLHLSSTKLNDEKQHYAAFKMAVFKIQQETFLRGKCTYYMLVFDYVNPTDMPFVKKVSDRLRVLSNSHHLILQALFIFKGTADNLQNDMIRQIIPEARLINFAPLGRNELEHCIRREASKIGIDLRDKDYIVEQVANHINVTRHGCKPVRAKLLLHSG
ncbi:uncharacterized protein LOC128306993 [Anopheles moucheti]|uniref:uncharacterized protein LOC128306993 n=1 Tax=Anopheles moucheti TaxID=186751 RepID=UPI0022F01095|nr:uncharacterized protein LOC128306993 [Anopheles moucheti]